MPQSRHHAQRRAPLVATALLLGLAAGGSAHAARPTLQGLNTDMTAAQAEIDGLQAGQTALQTDVDVLLSADVPTNTEQLRIVGATVSFGPPDEIVIELDNFDGAAAPTVLLSGTPLTVTAFAVGSVTAETTGTHADGDYRLTVETGADYQSLASFDLTVADLEEQDPSIGTLAAGKWCNSDGSLINCTEDAPSDGITGVTAGSGLTGGGSSGDVTLAVDSGVVQSRVSGSCASGSSIRVINAGGSVTCQDAGIQVEVDGDTANELNTDFSLSGTTLSVTDAGGTVSQDIGLLQGDFVVKRTDGSEGFRMTSGGNFGIGDYWTNVGLNVKSAEATIFQAEDTDGTVVFKVLQDGNVGVGTAFTNIGLNVRSGEDIVLQIEDGSGSDLLQVHQNGHVTINDDTDYSDVQFNILSDVTYPVYVRSGSNTRLMSLSSDGNLTIDGSLTESSDARLKDAVADLGYGLDEVLAMQPRAYVFKDRPEVPEIGLIAQELYQIIPEAVTPGTEPATAAATGEALEAPANPYWSIAYTKLIPVLVQAIQDQQAVIEQQQAQLDALGDRLDAAGL